MKQSLLVALACVCGTALLSSPAIAQGRLGSANEGGVYQESEKSSLYGESGDFNPYSLIHRMRLGNRNTTEFLEESDKEIESAAASYHSELLEYWRQQKQENTAETATTGVE